jgi:hypothetical protein
VPKGHGRCVLLAIRPGGNAPIKRLAGINLAIPALRPEGTIAAPAPADLEAVMALRVNDLSGVCFAPNSAFFLGPFDFSEMNKRPLPHNTLWR